MRWWLTAFAIGVYLVGLAVMAPATLLDVPLERATGARLTLAGATGSLWAGRAQLEARDPAGREGLGTPVAWKLDAPELLRGRLAYRLTTGTAGVRTKLVLMPGRLLVDNGDFTFPAQALGLAVPKLGALALTGELHVRFGQLEAGTRSLKGDIVMQWRDAGSALAGPAPLGDYELLVHGGGASVRAELRTLKGPVQLEGQGSWALGTRPALLATARIPPQERDHLAPLMRLISVERGPGVFELKLP
jgi:general secretion pathway protein N